MSSNVCSQCGAPLEGDLNFCKYCGTKVERPVYENIQQPQPQPQYVPPQPQYQPPQPQPTSQYGQNQGVYTPPMKKVPVKSKVTAGVLAILLGGIGVHKFYLGKTFQGILCLLFCWTYIPGIIGFIEGIVYLCKNDEAWAQKVGYRLE